MWTRRRIVDLSWPVVPGMPQFPGDPPVELRPMGVLAEQGYASHLAVLPAHTGTHVDAPGHVLAGGAMLADLPLARFCGPGAVLDLRSRPARAIGAEDLAPHMPGLAVKTPAFVLLCTGAEALWGGAAYFAQGPYLEPAAAELLAGLAGRGLLGVGLEASGADPAEARELRAHAVLLGAGLVLVENLRGLGGVPARGFTFLCLPVLGLDGSPVRAAALLDPEEAPAGLSDDLSDGLPDGQANAPAGHSPDGRGGGV